MTSTLLLLLGVLLFGADDEVGIAEGEKSVSETLQKVSTQDTLPSRPGVRLGLQTMPLPFPDYPGNYLIRN